MGHKKFSREEIERLRANPYVADVDEDRIVYTDEFRERFIAERGKGIGPTEIFVSAGFDPEVLGPARIYRASDRWRGRAARPARFSGEEIERLKANPNVADADSTRIVYSKEFRERFLEEYERGAKPTEIFRAAGLGPEVIGAKRIEKASARWRGRKS